MTEDQKYLELIKAFGELVRTKNNHIFYLEHEITRLKKIIEEAEKTLTSEITAETK